MNKELAMSKIDEMSAELADMGCYELAWALRAVLDAETGTPDAPVTDEDGVYVRMYNSARYVFYAEPAKLGMRATA